MTNEENIDISLNINDDGIYDISFTDTGDFLLDNSFETSIKSSIFLDRRADESEVQQPENRRGWFGNKELYSVDHEIGSKLWLAFTQKRNTVKTRNDAKGYMRDCLQWLIDDGHATEITVNASNDSLSELILTAEIKYSSDTIKTVEYNLWQNTINFL